MSEIYSFNLEKKDVYELDDRILKVNKAEGTRLTRSFFVRILLGLALEEAALFRRVLSACKEVTITK